MDQTMIDPDPDIAHRAVFSPPHSLPPRSAQNRFVRILDRLRSRFASRHKDSLQKYSVADPGHELMVRSHDLQALTVSELMRPAHEMVYLSAAHETQQNLDLVARTRFSRYPYFADDGETLLGMVHFKDLYPLGPRGADFKAILRKAMVVPPETPVPELFRRFKRGASHFALIGHPGEHPVGFLTIDNLLGALVGEIRDEFRRDGGHWNLQDDGSLLGKGSMSLFSLKHALGIALPDQRVDSVSGLVMEQLGRMPREGERIAFKAFDIVIKRMQGPRIQLLKVIPAGRQAQAEPTR
jgi:CBS domain containing-hemolysin-like protein